MMFKSALQFWSLKKVLSTLILIVVTQVIISYKSLEIIFLKENILKKTTNHVDNPFIKNQKEWLSNQNTDQTVMIIVDALGYYLADPNLSIFHHFLETQSNNTLFLKSKTDSLTVTGPRLLSIMTGTNPTVIDLIQNVEHSSETKIDNLMQKMNEKNKTIFFTGDNTWLKLFPHSFTYYTNDNSFDVFDYFKQDENNIEFVMSSLDTKILDGNQEKDIDLIIAHFLGIDHIFHSRKNVFDPLVEVKYKQYSEFFADVISKLGNRTLIIQSDHGATPQGNHGDDSSYETEAFFFAYRKNGFAKNSKVVKGLLKDIPSYPINLSQKQDTLLDENRSINQKGELKGVLQIDLAVNLANILGVSLPYSSLGMVWPIFYNEFNENNPIEEKIFKDNLANDSYTAIKQQLQLLKENDNYHSKIGDQKFAEFMSKGKLIDQLYENYRRSDSDFDQLKLLFENVFNLNMIIKDQLSGNMSLKMKKNLTEMTIFEISVVILIAFISFRLNEYIYRKDYEIHAAQPQEQGQQDVIDIYNIDMQGTQIIPKEGEEDIKKNNFEIYYNLIIVLILFFTVQQLNLFDQYLYAQIPIYFFVLCILANLVSLKRLQVFMLKYILTRNFLIVFQIWLNYYIISLQTEFFTTHDADLFKILITSLLMYLFLNKFESYQNLFIMLIVILTAQYSMKNPSLQSCPSLKDFPQGYFEIISIKNILNTSLCSIIIPGFICLFCLHQYILQYLPSRNFLRYKVLLYLQFTLSFLFVLISSLYPDIGNTKVILVYLPRIQFIVFICQNYFTFINSHNELKSEENYQEKTLSRNGKLLLLIMNFISLNFIFIGEKSFLATVLFFGFLFFYRKYLNDIKEKSSFLQILILFILSFYFFFVTDHKYGFGNLQIKSGYIGMGEYVEAYALVFITINTITWQLYMMAIYPLFSEASSHSCLKTMIFESNSTENSDNEGSLFKQESQLMDTYETKNRLRLDYLYFVFLFTYKYLFILGVFAKDLGNDQAHKLLPYLIGEIMFSNVGYGVALIALIFLNYSFKKKKD